MNTPEVIVPIAAGIWGGAIITYALTRTEPRRPYYRLDSLPTTKNVPHIKVPSKIDKWGLKKDISKTINEFISTMKNADVDITNLYENFYHGIIEQRKGNDCGTYDKKRRKLIVDPDDIRSSLLRALLDMCISRDYSRFEVSGFARTNYTSTKDSQRKEVQSFGMGLSEGYKDIFLQRYFDLSPKFSELRDLASLIEIAIGQKEMESLFVKGDINNLCLEMSKTYRQCVNPNYWAIGEQTIFMMDRLYNNIYKSDLIGVVLSHREFSSFLADMTIFATSAVNKRFEEAKQSIARRCFHPANDVFWEASPTKFEHYSQREMSFLLKESTPALATVREIVNKYSSSKTFKPSFTKSDFAKISRAEKKCSLRPNIR